MMLMGAVVGACGDDVAGTDDIDASAGIDAAGVDATTSQAVTINFDARVGAMQAQCGMMYADQGSNDNEVEFLDLRFYVSNVRLLNGTTESPVTLTASAFQSATVGLLDFEDMSGNCEGNTVTNTSLTGTVPVGTYDGIVFDLGVPFDLNHTDPIAATTEAPLDIMSLHWAWLTGRRFAKIDVQPTGEARWNFHLGSTACMNGGGGPTVPPTAECTRPNRPEIRIAGFDAAADTINVMVDELLNESDLEANTAATPPGCQSFSAPTMQAMFDADCTEAFVNLGLDISTGACTTDCSDQSVFVVAP